MIKTVSLSFYLVVGQRFKDSGSPDGKPTIRTTIRKPSVDPDEVPILLQFDLPAALFRRPTLAARITVPDTDAPLAITPQVQHDITRVLQEQLGIVVHVEAPEGGAA
jgi:hypothetical protein